MLPIFLSSILDKPTVFVEHFYSSLELFKARIDPKDV